MVITKDVVHDKTSPTSCRGNYIYRLRMKEGIKVLEHLNFFNKIISELLIVDVKINEKNKTLILLNSLLESYDRIAAAMFYGKNNLYHGEGHNDFVIK